MHYVRRLARLIYAALTHILPLSSDEHRARHVTSAHVQMAHVRKHNTPVTICMSIDEPPVRALIHTLKYHGNTESVDHLAALLAPYIESLCIRESIDMIVPVPLARQRHRSRGFNQVTYACEHIARHAPALQPLISPHILRRTRDTAPQTHLGKSERHANVRGAFACTQDISGSRILLIDDVVTTGATLLSARHALLEARAASVALVAFAGR